MQTQETSRNSGLKIKIENKNTEQNYQWPHTQHELGFTDSFQATY